MGRDFDEGQALHERQHSNDRQVSSHVEGDEALFRTRLAGIAGALSAQAAGNAVGLRCLNRHTGRAAIGHLRTLQTYQTLI